MEGDWQFGSKNRKRKIRKSKASYSLGRRVQANVLKILNEAQDAYVIGNHDRAVTLFSECIKLHPNLSTPYYTLGLIYEEHYLDNATALHFYILAANYTPKKLHLWQKVLKFSLKLNDNEDALIAAKHLLKSARITSVSSTAKNVEQSVNDCIYYEMLSYQLELKLNILNKAENRLASICTRIINENSSMDNISQWYYLGNCIYDIPLSRSVTSSTWEIVPNVAIVYYIKYIYGTILYMNSSYSSGHTVDIPEDSFSPEFLTRYAMHDVFQMMDGKLCMKQVNNQSTTGMNTHTVVPLLSNSSSVEMILNRMYDGVMKVVDLLLNKIVTRTVPVDDTEVEYSWVEGDCLQLLTAVMECVMKYSTYAAENNLAAVSIPIEIAVMFSVCQFRQAASSIARPVPGVTTSSALSFAYKSILPHLFPEASGKPAAGTVGGADSAAATAANINIYDVILENYHRYGSAVDNSQGYAAGEPMEEGGCSFVPDTEEAFGPGDAKDGDSDGDEVPEVEEDPSGHKVSEEVPEDGYEEMGDMEPAAYLSGMDSLQALDYYGVTNRALGSVFFHVKLWLYLAESFAMLGMISQAQKIVNKIMDFDEDEAMDALKLEVKQLLSNSELLILRYRVANIYELVEAGSARNKSNSGHIANQGNIAMMSYLKVLALSTTDDTPLTNPTEAESNLNSALAAGSSIDPYFHQKLCMIVNSNYRFAVLSVDVGPPMTSISFDMLNMQLHTLRTACQQQFHPPSTNSDAMDGTGGGSNNSTSTSATLDVVLHENERKWMYNLSADFSYYHALSVIQLAEMHLKLIDDDKFIPNAGKLEHMIQYCSIWLPITDAWMKENSYESCIHVLNNGMTTGGINRNMKHHLRSDSIDTTKANALNIFGTKGVLPVNIDYCKYLYLHFGLLTRCILQSSNSSSSSNNLFVNYPVIAVLCEFLYVEELFDTNVGHENIAEVISNGGQYGNGVVFLYSHLLRLLDCLNEIQKALENDVNDAGEQQEVLGTNSVSSIAADVNISSAPTLLVLEQLVKHLQVFENQMSGVVMELQHQTQSTAHALTIGQTAMDGYIKGIATNWFKCKHHRTSLAVEKVILHRFKQQHYRNERRSTKSIANRMQLLNQSQSAARNDLLRGMLVYSVANKDTMIPPFILDKLESAPENVMLWNNIIERIINDPSTDIAAINCISNVLYYYSAYPMPDKGASSELSFPDAGSGAIGLELLFPYQYIVKDTKDLMFTNLLASYECISGSEGGQYVRRRYTESFDHLLHALMIDCQQLQINKTVSADMQIEQEEPINKHEAPSTSQPIVWLYLAVLHVLLGSRVYNSSSTQHPVLIFNAFSCMMMYAQCRKQQILNLGSHHIAYEILIQQEVLYNIGRIYADLGLNSYAMDCYKLGLKYYDDWMDASAATAPAATNSASGGTSVNASPVPKAYFLTKELAFNLVLLYKESNNRDQALEIMFRYLTYGDATD